MTQKYTTADNFVPNADRFSAFFYLLPSDSPVN